MPDPTQTWNPAAKEKSRNANDEFARLEEQTREELFALAQKLRIPGHSEMSRADLIEAIRRR